jgi:hypothetical protein
MPLGLYEVCISVFQVVENCVFMVTLRLIQIIMATEPEPGNLTAHSRGVAAILSSENSPFDIFSDAKLFQLGNPLVLKGTLEVWQTTMYRSSYR